MGIPGKIGDVIECCQWRMVNGEGECAGSDLDLRSRAAVYLDGGWKNWQRSGLDGDLDRYWRRWDGTDAHQPPKREKSRRMVDRLKKKAGDGVGLWGESMLRIRVGKGGASKKKGFGRVKDDGVESGKSGKTMPFLVSRYK